MTPENKRTRALNDAYTMFAFWPVILGSRAIERVITSGGQADPYVIDMIERELDGTVGEVTMTHYQEPEFIETVSHSIKPAASVACPCGYVTECHIHCGDGSCHTEDPWVVVDGPEIILTEHPETIRLIKKPGRTYGR
jgi:hypothetical protein